MLLDASTRFIEQACPLTAVREAAYAEDGFARSYRAQAGELGWFSFLVPEALGGGSVSGNGAVDAALVAYRRGRLLQPGPFVGTNVVAAALGGSGTDEYRSAVLPGLMAGAVLGGLGVRADTRLARPGGRDLGGDGRRCSPPHRPGDLRRGPGPRRLAPGDRDDGGRPGPVRPAGRHPGSRGGGPRGARSQPGLRRGARRRGGRAAGAVRWAGARAPSAASWRWPLSSPRPRRSGPWPTSWR